MPEFFALASHALNCRWTLLHARVAGDMTEQRKAMEFAQLGYRDHCAEMRALLRELMPDGGKQPCWRPGL